MEAHRLAAWESLFRKALQIIDSVDADILPPDRWSFGGGTVLMRRYRHRFSKDIDLFVPDPQYLGHLSPRLNDTVEAMTTHYIEQANFIKFYFPEGEIDVVAAGALTLPSSKMETILGRQVQVETSAEILAKRSTIEPGNSPLAICSTLRSSPRKSRARYPTYLTFCALGAIRCSRASMRTRQRCASCSRSWMSWSIGAPTMSVWIW